MPEIVPQIPLSQISEDVKKSNELFLADIARMMGQSKRLKEIQKVEKPMMKKKSKKKITNKVHRRISSLWMGSSSELVEKNEANSRNRKLDTTEDGFKNGESIESRSKKNRIINEDDTSNFIESDQDFQTVNKFVSVQELKYLVVDGLKKSVLQETEISAENSGKYFMPRKKIF